VLTSPAQRCAATATIIADLQQEMTDAAGRQRALPAVCHLDELINLDVGRWQGQPARLVGAAAALRRCPLLRRRCRAAMACAACQGCGWVVSPPPPPALQLRGMQLPDDAEPLAAFWERTGGTG